MVQNVNTAARFPNLSKRRIWILLAIGLPVVCYLLAAAWVSLDLPFPKQTSIRWIDGVSNGSRLYLWPGIPTIFTFDGYSNDLVYPLDGSFRKMLAPLVLIGLITGIAARFITSRFSTRILRVATGLVILASVAFLAWELLASLAKCSLAACYKPGGHLQNLGVHDLAHNSRSFAVTIEVVAITTLLVIMGLWFGTELGKILRSYRS